MKPTPRTAFTEVSGFEAKKHAIRQTTDGLWQLTLTVHEFGQADWLVFAPTGLPLAIGLKAMDYDNPEPEVGDNPNKKYIQRAVMLCKDVNFQRYMEALAQDEGFYDWGLAEHEAEAANALKAKLRIKSRSELGNSDAEALRQKMDNLVKNFRVWIR